jgi:hypothetical protein
MAKLLRLDIARARFLAACSHADPRDNPNMVIATSRGEPILYDDTVLIREACRIGISAKDTAKMMNLPIEYIKGCAVKFGLKFRTKSKHRPQNAKGVHSLFLHEEPDPYRCQR